MALVRSGSSYLEELLRDRPLVRLGGEGSYAGQAVVSLESLKDGNPLVRASGARVVARLATPALLELKDLELAEPGTPVIASKKVLENIVREESDRSPIKLIIRNFKSIDQVEM